MEPQSLTINKPSHDDDIPFKIIHKNQSWEVASLGSTIAGDGYLMRWMTPASSTHWWSGVWGTDVNGFNTWFNHKGLQIKPTGDASISETLEVQRLPITNTTARPIEINNAMHNGPYLVAISQNYSNNNLLFALRCPPLNHLWCSGVTASNQYIISHENSTKFNIQPNGNTTVSGSFYNNSDDRLKENEELIENACETLSKLRPQFHDKEPDMKNDDPTTWYKESGLIAQEIYYDAPELRHLVHRGRHELDDEGNSVPLPEIPTSIDPQDPGYSSWGEEPASINYIGLIAYLIKANTQLHERVKAFEG